jgi:hypothetical protein
VEHRADDVPGIVDGAVETSFVTAVSSLDLERRDDAGGTLEPAAEHALEDA